MKKSLLFDARAWCALLLLVVGLAFWPGLSGGFIFDDWSALVENPRLHIETVDAESLKRAATSFEPGGTFGARPLVMLSFGLNHAIHGMDPWGYKLVGWLVHLINSLLVFAFVRRVVQQAAPQTPVRLSGASTTTAMLPSPVVVAGVVALLWAIHPLQVSSVLYVVQRMETLSITFVLAALLTYLRGRINQIEGRPGWPWLLACIPLVLLGWASKESAVLFPAFALALELSVLGFAARKASIARLWRWGFGISTSIAILVFFLVVLPHYWSPETITGRNFNTAERLFTQLRVLCTYLWQIVLPLPSSMPFYYDNYTVSTSLFSPATTLLSALFLAGLLTSAFALRQRAPLYSFGVLLFFAAHAITSNVVALELVFEHRNYFALLGVLLALTALFLKLPVRDKFAAQWGGAVLLCVMALFLTVIRAATWGDQLHLASDLADKNPHSARASADLATYYSGMADGYSNSPFNDFAMREFERGSLLPGSSIVSDQGLLLVATRAGRPVYPVWWDRLIAKLNTQPITPDTTHAMFGLLRNRLNDVPLDDDKLVDAFLAMFNRVGFPAYSYAQFGEYVIVHVGDQVLADQIYALATRASKDDPDYMRRMVEVLLEDGHVRQARVVASTAAEMGVVLDIELPPDPNSDRDEGLTAPGSD
ncbi:hypothetical protein [Denitratimonas sp. CY0512]|uniref:hypothetical protein n=1 Tax=Denitratimonas sp. CY0512 TaxID=3131940 RepID=UPI0030953A19